jgi:hypothetical protein
MRFIGETSLPHGHAHVTRSRTHPRQANVHFVASSFSREVPAPTAVQKVIHHGSNVRGLAFVDPDDGKGVRRTVDVEDHNGLPSGYRAVGIDAFWFTRMQGISRRQ